MPVREALDICRQVAEALEAAHEKGIIRRDLKPANVKITPEGKVKVLDFGLAKPTEASPMAMGQAEAATITAEMTQARVVLGTAAYMSPEQACAKPLDARTDIWSFGCVLYEALTGMRMFKGETTTEVLAGILEREPELLPGGKAMIFTVSSAGIDSFDDARIDAIDLGTKRRKSLIQGGTCARYSPPGHLTSYTRGPEACTRCLSMRGSWR